PGSELAARPRLELGHDFGVLVHGRNVIPRLGNAFPIRGALQALPAPAPHGGAPRARGQRGNRPRSARPAALVTHPALSDAASVIASAAMRSAFVIPALDAERTIGALASELAVRTQGRDAWLEPSVIVVDDGSSDRTAEVARAAGAEVVRHDENRGKGAALLTG